jgi:hypothetical protein
MKNATRTAGAVVAGLLATVAFAGSAQAQTSTVQIHTADNQAMHASSSTTLVPRTRVIGQNRQRFVKRNGASGFATYESVQFPGRCITVNNRNSGERLRLAACQNGNRRQLWTQGFGSGLFKKFENLDSVRAATIESGTIVQRFDTGLNAQRWRVRVG